MTSVPWDRYFRPSGADRFRGPEGIQGAVRDGSRWFSLLLLLVAAFAMTNSLEDANWVREMPSLTVAALTGLLTGWVLAQLPYRQWLLQLSGIALGLVVVFALVLNRMELADPLLGRGVRPRLTELWLRLRDWFGALLDGSSSSDPLPFVLALILVVWAVSYTSAWGVLRWRNVWVALIPPGFVLLTNISYLRDQSSVQLVLFLFVAVLLVLQLHYERALSRWRRDQISWPQTMSFELLFAGVWIALALIVAAWLVPTANHWGPIADTWSRAIQPASDRLEGLSRVFVGVSANRDLPVHNFGDVLPMRGGVSLSDDPLMSIESERPGNFRGAVYDRYTGSGWRVSSAEARPQIGTTVEAAGFGTPLSQAQLREPVTATITVLGPVPSRRLLIPGDPLATDIDADLIFGAGLLDVIGVIPERRLAEGDSYTVVGAVNSASQFTMLTTPTDYPESIFQRYTQLPGDLPPEVAVLTRDLVGEGAHPYQAARVVEQYLRTLPYTLDVADPPPLTDAVGYFLLEARAGYFDHHASAMAVMLRTVGIPTRMAAGFALDEEDFDPASKSFVLTEEDAWAWPEVYLPGIGWVEFNPTPARPLVERVGSEFEGGLFPGSSEQLVGLLTEEEMLEELEALFDMEPASGLPEGFFATDGPGIGALVVRVVTIWVAVATALLVLTLGTRLAWTYHFRRIPGPQRPWAKIQQIAAWASLHPPEVQTPREWAEELAEMLGDEEDLVQLVTAYTTVRYGGNRAEPRPEESERLDAAYRRVRSRLWWRVATRPIPRWHSRSAVSLGPDRPTPGI